MFKPLSRRSAIGLISAATLLTSVSAGGVFAEGFSKDNPLKVALVLHGTLGDKSFFDSAAAGMKMATEQLPVTVKIIEAGYDKTKWQPALADAADSGYDVVIAGTFDMTPYITDLANQYPNVKFIDFDDSPDFTGGAYPNVLAVMYGTSTAGYLAGYAAAKLSKTGVLDRKSVV